jgi:HTH-type transcriptional regulator, competence development regulator
MTNLEQFGEYLRAARQRKGLSLRAVEAAIGISNAYLSQLEQGKIKQPSPVDLHKLSQLYDLSYAEVMRLIGYPVPGEDDEQSSSDIAARLGPVTEAEEDELVDYLRFLRSRRKGDD